MTTLKMISTRPYRHEYNEYYPLEFMTEENTTPAGLYEYTVYTRKDGSYFFNVRNCQTKVRNKMFKHPKTDLWFFHFTDLEGKNFSISLDDLYKATS